MDHDGEAQLSWLCNKPLYCIIIYYQALPRALRVLIVLITRAIAQYDQLVLTFCLPAGPAAMHICSSCSRQGWCALAQHSDV